MIALGPLVPFTGAPRRAESREPRCELCGGTLAAQHRHVLELGAADARGVRCACGPCAVLFATDAPRPRYRTVPERVRNDPAFAMSAARWAALGAPVALAFFVRDAAGAVVARYPGPAGVTEAALEPDAWAAIRAATPLAGALAPDVEALLVHGDRGAPLACWLVPITAAYELCGRLRACWTGFSGGDAAQQELAAFFAELEGSR
jgi:hypothetical protein